MANIKKIDLQHVEEPASLGLTEQKQLLLVLVILFAN
jgi:hypothetical protein